MANKVKDKDKEKEIKMVWDDLEDSVNTIRCRRRGNDVTIHSKKMRLGSCFFRFLREEYNAIYVVPRFSKSNNAIVLKFTNDYNLPGALKISENGVIAAIGFFKRNNIDISKYKNITYTSFLERISNLGEVWIVYLDTLQISLPYSSFFDGQKRRIRRKKKK